MNIKPGTTACPRCGGRSGFFTTQRRTVSRLYGWDGSGEDADDTQVVSESAPRCMDCNKLVRSVVESSGGVDGNG